MNNSDLSDFPDFHFIAIGGVGQSALAKILLQLGYKVSGSDINDSKYVHLVEKLGAKVYIGHNKDNIKGTPKIVVSSAIKDDNPEIIRAKELKLDLIPVAINTGKFWAKKQFCKKPGEVIIRILPPIPFSEIENENKHTILKNIENAVWINREQLIMFLIMIAILYLCYIIINIKIFIYKMVASLIQI